MPEVVAIEEKKSRILNAEEEEEEEEEDEAYDASKSKTTVKFVVEAELVDSDQNKIVIETEENGSKFTLINNLILDQGGLTELKHSVQYLRLDQEGLIEGKLAEENLTKEVDTSGHLSFIKESTSVETQPSLVQIQQVTDQSSPLDSELIEARVAEQIVQEAMGKAFQDAGNTFENDQLASESITAVQRLQKSPELIEHQMGTSYPLKTASIKHEADHVSAPANQTVLDLSHTTCAPPTQLSPVKVKVHLHSATPSVKQASPTNIPQQPAPANNVTRPQWSTPVAISPSPIIEARAPVTKQQQVVPKPISHQKLADQVAQKAVKNYQSQQDRQKSVKEVNALPAQQPVQQFDLRQQELAYNKQHLQQEPTPVDIARHTEFQQQAHVSPPEHQQMETRSRTFQECRRFTEEKPISTSRHYNEQARPVPEYQQAQNESREQSLERRMRLTKVNDPKSWVVQESVSANQLVKGAPWAKHQVEKKERIWPPPPPKVHAESIESAPQHQRQHEGYSSTENPFYQKYQEIYEEEKQPRVKETYRVPYEQQTQQSYPMRQYQGSPAQYQPLVKQNYNGTQISSSQTFGSNLYKKDQPVKNYEPQPPFVYTPQPMQKFLTSSQQEPSPRHQEVEHIQKFEPVRPVPFNPKVMSQRFQQQAFVPRQIRPDLNQPLTLDTQNVMSSPLAVQTHQFYHKQQSPRTIYKPQGPLSPEEVSAIIPPYVSNTSTPILPFTRQTEQQDYEKFQSQYSPGRTIYNVQPESHQYVTNQVTSIPGGTSFSRVQNTSSINFDTNTGDPYKENIQRVVRTTRTVPKTWK